MGCQPCVTARHPRVKRVVRPVKANMDDVNGESLPVMYKKWKSKACEAFNTRGALSNE